ncbi:MAG: aromatic ring-hydroxylating dioxygenase subunit alpha [Pyrinomonadaceae bacterium]
MSRAEAASDSDGLLERCISEQLPEHGLMRPFYTSSSIFELDIERVFFRHWLCVGHLSRIPEAGNYFLYRIAGESLIIIRDEEGGVNALINVCSHRGSPVCRHDEGSAKTLICPYHAWTYAPDGSLRGAPSMTETLDRASLSLRRCHVRIIEGLIFINFAAEPEEFVPESLRTVSAFLSHHDLSRATIGHREAFHVKANWKLVFENFSECYHCGPVHPEYCSVMYETRAGSQVRAVERSREWTETWAAEARRLGHMTGTTKLSPELPYFCSRTPIRQGFRTQSRSGAPVAPLMGGFREYDGGITQMRLYPVNYVIAPCDYAVLFRFTPLDAFNTEVELTWLVREGARAGKDFDVAALAWFWKVTTEQDREIVEATQMGVNSRFYVPGPYSEREGGAKVFVQWYLRELLASASHGSR